MPQTAFIIDPDRSGRDLMRSYLEREGFEVVDFADAAHALQTAIDTPPDVVVAEVFGMPVDGFAVCRGIRENPERSNTAVVLVSFLAAADRAAEAQADSFVLKPFDRSSFTGAIHSALAQRGHTSEKHA